MKILISLILFVLGFYLLNYNHEVVERGPSSIQDDESHIGYVAMLKGQVYRQEGSTLEVLKKNDFLYEKDVLVSKDKSFAKLIMKDKSQFNLGSNSKVSLDQYQINSVNEREISLNLIKGLLRSKIVNKNKKGFIQVKTPFAVMGVRGTEFINIVGAEQVELVLLEGVVVVDYTVNDLTNFEVPAKTKLYIPNIGLPSSKVIETQEYDYLNNNVLTNSGDFVSFYSDIENTTVKADGQSNESINNANGSDTSIQSENQITSADAQKQYAEHKTSVISVMQNKKEWNSLPTKNKEDLVEKQTTFIKEKSEELQRNNKAVVLITPDNKIVYFEDYPELKNKLPKDRNGDIIGIRVDENLNPITDLNISEAGLDKIKKLSDTTIPVVGSDGQVEMMEVANLADEKLLNIPVDESGLAVGISLSVLDTAVAEVANSDKNEISRETASETSGVDEISPTKISKDVTEPINDLMNVER